MANNTFWASVDSTFEVLGPGEFSDNNGQENELPVLVFGDAVMEGSLEDLRAAMHRALAAIGAAKLEAKESPQPTTPRPRRRR